MCLGDLLKTKNILIFEMIKCSYCDKLLECMNQYIYIYTLHPVVVVTTHRLSAPAFCGDGDCTFTDNSGRDPEMWRPSILEEHDILSAANKQTGCGSVDEDEVGVGQDEP